MKLGHFLHFDITLQLDYCSALKCVNYKKNVSGVSLVVCNVEGSAN